MVRGMTAATTESTSGCQPVPPSPRQREPAGNGGGGSEARKEKGGPYKNTHQATSLDRGPWSPSAPRTGLTSKLHATLNAAIFGASRPREVPEPATIGVFPPWEDPRDQQREMTDAQACE